jgi:hypothetical protein
MKKITVYLLANHLQLCKLAAVRKELSFQQWCRTALVCACAEQAHAALEGAVKETQPKRRAKGKK